MNLEEGRLLFERAAVALQGEVEAPASADHVMCLLFIARFRFYSGDAFAGIDPAARGVAMAQSLGDRGLVAKAMKMLGAVYLETGNFPDAISVLGQAYVAARESNDTTQEVGILSNLGLVYQHSGRFRDAVPCYLRAIEVTERSGDRNSPQERYNRAAALANLALAYLQMGDFSRGIAAAERTVETLPDPIDIHERVVRASVECYYTRLLLEKHDVAGARERALLAKKFSEGSTKLAEMFADMALGLVETNEVASRDCGLTRLQNVVNASRKGSASALRDALATIVRGYEAVGQPNAALVYLHEVMQLNRDSRVRSVLRHHHRHLANVSTSLQLDRAAQDAINKQRQELRFQRLSMDKLHHCMEVLEKNSVVAELHDDETGEHCFRVGALAKELALKKGMDGDMCTLIDLSARLHDIGKLRIPESILLKPGRLAAEERAIMEKHCEHGWELVGEGGLAQLFVAQEIALNHHERWDGTGYPNKRQGNMIPLAARITALADVFDALTHRRCYKEAWSVDEALREIANLRGKHFDPELTDLFLELIPELRLRHENLDLYLGAEARNNEFIMERERLARELRKDLGTYDLGV